MPLRVVCPSCSTQLSVRDEFVGRPVKCPKCDGVIPPESAMESPPGEVRPPSPEQIEAAFQDFSGSPLASESPVAPQPPTAAPARPRGEPTDADRPRRPGSRSRDDDDRGRSRRRPGRDEDDEDRGRPRRRRPPAQQDGSSGGTGKVLAIVGVVLLMLCVGGLGLGYVVFVKVRDAAREVRDRVEEMNNPTTQAKYDQIRLGMTRGEVDAIFRHGFNRTATEDDLNSAFRGDDKTLIAEWLPKVKQNRVVVWQRGNNYQFVAFYPQSDISGRVQMKAYMPFDEATAHDGIADDAKFAKEYGLAPVRPNFGSSPNDMLSTDELARAYSRDVEEADEKYSGIEIVLEGRIREFQPGSGGVLVVQLGSVSIATKTLTPQVTAIRCTVDQADVNRVLNHTPGQTLKLKGKCGGLNGTAVELYDCRFQSDGLDPAVSATAAGLIADYTRNPNAADSKFMKQPVVVSEGLVSERIEDERALIVVHAGKKGMKIKVQYDEKWDEWFEKYKPGDRIKVRGTCTGLDDGIIVIVNAWPVPGS